MKGVYLGGNARMTLTLLDTRLSVVINNVLAGPLLAEYVFGRVIILSVWQAGCSFKNIFQENRTPSKR